jgi:plastocyanin
MGSSSFTPANRTVAVGSVVTWQNTSGVGHNVTWDDAAGRDAAVAGDGAGDIGEFSSGSHTRVFNAAGTHGFHCTIHAGMAATVIVQ